MKKIEVVAAILFYGEEILCVQRAESKLSYISKKFEFPGGKIEDGETQKEALERELKEELNVNAEIRDLFLTVEHQYPDFEITMYSFICKIGNKEVVLNEHIDSKWLKREQLELLDWAEADIPIMAKLMANE